MNNASLTLTIEPLTEDKVKALVEAVAAAVTAAGGYELGSGGGDGAQIVSGEWWQPEYGCDSLGMTLDAIRARLVSAIGSWYGGCLKVMPVESPAAPPAPLEGEVGRLVEWLNAEADLRRNVLSTPAGLNLAQAARQADKLQSWANLIEAQAAALAAPPEGEVGELVAWLRLNGDRFGAEARYAHDPTFQSFHRAAALLQQQAAELARLRSAPAVVPVAVSERPWEREGWCDAEGRFWAEHISRSGVAAWRCAAASDLGGWAVRCLPAHAIPLPAQGGEGEG